MRGYHGSTTLSATAVMRRTSSSLAYLQSRENIMVLLGRIGIWIYPIRVEHWAYAPFDVFQSHITQVPIGVRQSHTSCVQHSGIISQLSSSWLAESGTVAIFLGVCYEL